MNICVWTDNDLDGAGCALLLKWLFKDKATKFDVKEADDNFVGVFKGWSSNIDQYDKIFITDTYVPDELLPLVDNKKFIIIDHHKTHVSEKDKYKIAKAIIEEKSSASELIRETFSQFKTILPESVQDLINIVDDYDSYTLKYKQTLGLNAIYGSYTNPRSLKFIENFENGIRPYTVYEENAIKLFLKKLKEQLDTECYRGMIKHYSVISCFANYAVNEVAHFILKKYNADIALVVNLSAKAVYIRRSKSCNAKLNVLAEQLCNGGGHEYAAGGMITEKFVNFTKFLTKC